MRVPFVRRRLIVWLPVLVVLAACEPTTAPTLAPTQISIPSLPAHSSGMTPFRWPAEHEESPDLSFSSATDAVTFLSEHMDGDIALPTWVPSKVDLDTPASVFLATRDGIRSAQLKLATERDEAWAFSTGSRDSMGARPSTPSP